MSLQRSAHFGRAVSWSLAAVCPKVYPFLSALASVDRPHQVVQRCLSPGRKGLPFKAVPTCTAWLHPRFTLATGHVSLPTARSRTTTVTFHLLQMPGVRASEVSNGPL
jgi:hypothetical protein